MSQDVQTGRGRTLSIVAWVLAPIALLGVLLVLTLRSSRVAQTGKPERSISHEENLLAAVRSTLAKQDDLATCKAVLPQLNSHLERAKGLQPAPLSEAMRNALRSQWGLTDDDLAEVASPLFTPLDAHHLEQCFLLRDAARSLELATPGGRGGKVKQTLLDRAELAFAWVMRQVRLQDAASPTPDGPAPPAFVLRRGWGSALERALVFLALLEQLGLDENPSSGVQGALLDCPGTNGQRRLWACGVAVAEQPETLFLFDPRLGLPVSGPDGKGVATLAQASANPAVLDQLRVDRLHYDVTSEQAKRAEVHLVCPLSALAPRMALLQDHLLRDRAWNDQPLPAPVRVRLAKDLPAAQAVLEAVVKHPGDKPERVFLWREGGTILRRFLPKEEGGSDVPRPFELRRLRGFTVEDDPAVVPLPRRFRAMLEVVSWTAFPAVFRDPRRFRWDYGVGQTLREVFMAWFQRPLMQPNSARDLILRGKPTRAAPELVKDQEHWQQMRQRLAGAGDLGPGVREWVERAESAYADLQRTKGTAEEAAAKEEVAEVWKWKENEPIAVLLFGSAARALAPEATYQLGLCKHETAARLQARKDLAARSGVATPDDAHKTDDAWKDAEGYWKEYVETYADRPGVVSARRLWGEAQAQRGQTREAVATWQNVSAPASELEKLANLWLAKQLSEQPKGK